MQAEIAGYDREPVSGAWGSTNRATHYDVQRGNAEGGEYAIVATEVAALGLVDEGLKADSVYYYRVRACNHLGCTEFSDDPVGGITEFDGDVDVPAVPKDVRVVRKKIEVFPDLDEVTWTAVEGVTYYEVYRAGDRLTAVSAPLMTGYEKRRKMNMAMPHGNLLHRWVDPKGFPTRRVGLAVVAAFLVILITGCSGQQSPTPAAGGERTDPTSTTSDAQAQTTQAPSETGTAATPATVSATAGESPGEKENAYKLPPRPSDAASLEEYLALWISQLPQTEQDCLSEGARAGSGWPDLTDDPVDNQILPCLSDSSLALMYVVRFIEEGLAVNMAPQLTAKSRECLTSSSLGGLIRKTYADADFHMDETDEKMVDHINYFCLTHEELAHLDQDVPAEDLQTFKRATEAVGGLEAFTEGYSSTLERILSDLLGEGEEPVMPEEDVPPSPP